LTPVGTLDELLSELLDEELLSELLEEEVSLEVPADEVPVDELLVLDEVVCELDASLDEVFAELLAAEELSFGAHAQRPKTAAAAKARRTLFFIVCVGLLS
jgi:hypothetical protein